MKSNQLHLTNCYHARQEKFRMLIQEGKIQWHAMTMQREASMAGKGSLNIVLKGQKRTKVQFKE